MKKRIERAKSWLLAAGKCVMDGLAKPIDVQTKGNRRDLVTNLDQASEALIREKIQAYYPNDKIIGEEARDLPSWTLEGSVWFIDPIDGTMNFVLQETDFVLMLAYYEAGVGQFGMIYDPIHEKFWLGIQGEGVFLNGEQVHLNQVPSLANALLSIEPHALLRDAYHCQALFKEAMGLRLYGACGVAMTRVMAGQLGGYLLSALAPWDLAAGAIMAGELGLVCCQVDGSPIALLKPRQQVIFASKTVAAAFFALQGQ